MRLARTPAPALAAAGVLDSSIFADTIIPAAAGPARGALAVAQQPGEPRAGRARPRAADRAKKPDFKIAGGSA
jgi:hypothetical protein